MWWQMIKDKWKSIIKNMQWDIQNIVMVVIKHLEISALNYS